MLCGPWHDMYTNMHVLHRSRDIWNRGSFKNTAVQYDGWVLVAGRCGRCVVIRVKHPVELSYNVRMNLQHPCHGSY